MNDPAILPTAIKHKLFPPDGTPAIRVAGLTFNSAVMASATAPVHDVECKPQDKVISKFGAGEVVSMRADNPECPVEVRLVWGATGYFTHGELTISSPPEQPDDSADGLKLLKLTDRLISIVGSQKRVCDEFNTPQSTFSVFIRNKRNNPNYNVSGTVDILWRKWLSVLNEQDEATLLMNSPDPTALRKVLLKLYGPKCLDWITSSFMQAETCSDEESTGSNAEEEEPEEVEANPNEKPCTSSEILRADKVNLSTHSTFCEGTSTC